MPEKFFERWFEEVWNKGRAEAIDEMIAPECVVYRADETGGDRRGPEEFKQFFEQIRGAFSDIQATVEDSIHSGNKVAARFKFEATHTGDGLGFPATNRRISITGMCWSVVENGRGVEAWNNWDQLSLMKQLGALGKP